MFLFSILVDMWEAKTAKLGQRELKQVLYTGFMFNLYLWFHLNILSIEVFLCNGEVFCFLYTDPNI